MPHGKKAPGSESVSATIAEGDKDTMEANATPAGLNIALDEPTQALIGHCLKAVYAEIVEQPVPEQLLKLLDELERQEQQ